MLTQTAVNRRAKARKIRRRRQALNRSPGLTQMLPAYPGQPTFAVSIQSIPIKLTTTVITSVTGLDHDILQLSTALFDVFEEYRCVGADVAVEMFSSVNPGILKFWIDENTSATPTSTAALQAVGRSVNMSSVDKIHKLSWRPSDPTDLGYSVSTNVNPAYLKFYTDNAFFGAPIVVTAVACATVTLHLQFRGMAT